MAKVAIIGAYSSPMMRARYDTSLQDLGFLGARAALDDAGLRRADVDLVVIGAHDLTDGRGIANMVGAGAAGAYMKSETRTTNDGVFALALGANAILAGRAKRVLVVSWAKPSEGFDDGVTGTEFEPFHQRSIGLTEQRALGLQAAAILGAFGPGARAAASSAVAHDRARGAANPSAHLREVVAAEDVALAPVASWPLTGLDLPPRSDGVAAIVLASEDAAGDDAVWVTGIGWSTDTYALGHRDLTTSPSLARAATSAYKAADLDPTTADIVEYGARSSFQHQLIVEALGLCPEGQGAEFLLSDTEAAPRNPSGGLACSNPLLAAGLMSIALTVERMRTGAGPHAIVHGSSGMCLQSNAVAVLERGRS